MESQETFEETTLEDLKAKSYKNRFIDEDVKVACDSTDLVNKPHYKWRVYVTETTRSGSTEGVYSRDKQRILGMQHNSTIDKPQG